MAPNGRRDYNAPPAKAPAKTAKVSRRDGREAEGAPLLREYGAYTSIEGSNPSLSATTLFYFADKQGDIS